MRSSCSRPEVDAGFHSVERRPYGPRVQSVLCLLDKARPMYPMNSTICDQSCSSITSSFVGSDRQRPIILPTDLGYLALTETPYNEGNKKPGACFQELKGVVERGCHKQKNEQNRTSHGWVITIIGEINDFAAVTIHQWHRGGVVLFLW